GKKEKTMIKVGKWVFFADLELAKSWSFPVLEKIMRPTSASHKMASSLAFFSSPVLLLEKVTCRLVELSMRRITIFPLPILGYLLLSSSKVLNLAKTERREFFFVKKQKQEVGKKNN
ncbi:hypothetical protein ACLOJK_003192, partial [Asimina triloba]